MTGSLILDSVIDTINLMRRVTFTIMYSTYKCKEFTYTSYLSLICFRNNI